MGVTANLIPVSNSQEAIVAELYDCAPRLLARMYDSDEKLFVFRLRKTDAGIVREGLSRRYTAIALIGLANESKAVQAQALAGDEMNAVCLRLESELETCSNLGDVALIAWAMGAAGYAGLSAAWRRLDELDPQSADHPTVELAWALSSLCLYGSNPKLRNRIAARLIESYSQRSHLFPHWIGKSRGWRGSHVSCFADLVYPIQALSHFFQRTGEWEARAAAIGCARQICRLQGDAGQWWWHYDYRTGEIVEKYPVYAIHQDAMAPMALRSCQEATGADFTAAIRKGMEWLAGAPELGGLSLIDRDIDLVWRKVARREPRKLVRYAQAVASGVHAKLRVPAVDHVFPPTAIDYEVRPYHLGWFLHAWTR
jgi:hypothetical protein